MYCPCHDEVKVVDLATGQAIRTLEGVLSAFVPGAHSAKDTDPVLSVVLSPDNDVSAH